MDFKAYEAAIADALTEFAKEVNPKAYLTHSVAVGERGIQVAIGLYPDGLLGKTPSLYAHCSTFEECLAELKTRWVKISNNHRATTINTMAHAIIEITHRTGSCTSLALGAEFDASDIARYGAEAVKLANNMSAKGPFEILEAAGANHAEG